MKNHVVTPPRGSHPDPKSSKRRILLFLLLSVITCSEARQVLAQPQVTDPSKFRVELYADLAPLGRLKAWQLTFSNGENGFPAGLYATSGPLPDDRSDRIIRINGPGQITVVKDGFTSNESLVFARGAYGTGMLITEPQERRIVRLLADGTRTVFSTNFTAPFGPAVLAYGPTPNTSGRESVLGSETLYATDFSGGRMLIVNPDGTTATFASSPQLARIKGSTNCPSCFLGGFVVGVFNFRDNPDTGGIYSVSPDGGKITQVAGNLNTIQLLTSGPGGIFGSDIFVCSEGRQLPDLDVIGDGAVFTLDRKGVLTPFLTNIDAASVAFDTDGVLGGGMFVADIFDDPNRASKIWRVVPIAPIPTLSEWGMIVLALSLLTVGAIYVLRRKRVETRAT